ncbi:uncharacterized protein LOC110711266 [Chenopodium quinoa]|uniref:uncharacterized protein LOC110711266 n=1 Tax=Chenopodium quinoa TaxID=63459 RepID=UPI000B77AB3E|nr:uncharacterized protein LOC110711266 [Chenopodium quinoa]
MSLNSVNDNVVKFTPNFCYGVDSVGSKGELALFGWVLGDVSCISTSPNYICKMEEANDFNQVESLDDKLGGTTLIKGLDFFLDWKFQSGMLDVPFSGPRYTWSNKRVPERLVLERLDRAYCFSNWLNDFPDGRVFHEPIVVSNHAAILYDSNSLVLRSNRPYQMERWCLSFPEIGNFILEGLGMECVGSDMFRLMAQPKWVRKMMRKWFLDNKRLWGVNWRQVSNDLQAKGENISTVLDGAAYVGAITTILPQPTLQFHYWRQQMKDRWIKQGQHEVESLIRNSLLNVFKPPASFSEGIGERVDLVLRELDLPKISELYKLDLMRPFSHQEVRKAMFSIHNLKSPSPDGIIAEFFHQHLEKVGTEVSRVVLSFFSTGCLLKEINASLLVMLPKVDTPELASQFRPISLCNTIYKCIAKCKVNKMKTLLPSLITKYQHAFVPERYMEDNVLLSHELLHMINTNKGRADKAAIKIDMSKAYDRLNWTFILKVLHAYGFPAWWVHRISQCISMVSYRTLVTDDSCASLVEVFHRFGDISGQQLNLSKSCVKFSSLVS